MAADKNDPFYVGDAPLLFDESAQSTASSYNLEQKEIEDLSVRAKAGYADAAFRLHLYFKFVTLDVGQSNKWLCRAAELGHSVASGNLLKRKESEK